MLKQHELGEVFYAYSRLDQQECGPGPADKSAPLRSRCGTGSNTDGPGTAGSGVGREVDGIYVVVGIICRLQSRSAECTTEPAATRCRTSGTSVLNCMGCGTGHPCGAEFSIKRMAYNRRCMGRCSIGGIDTGQ